MTAAAYGYDGAIADLTEEEAIAIYKAGYWVRPGYDKLYNIFPALAAYMLQVGINVGPVTASAFLQRALNAMSDKGRLYPTLKVDGICGPATRAALSAYIEVRLNDNGDAVLMGVMRSLAVANYIEIAEQTPGLAVFEYGWLRVRALQLS